MVDENFDNSPNHKMVMSLREVRLASTRGPVAIVPAKVPTRIPRALFLEAAKNGCVDYNPEMIEAFKDVISSIESGEAEAPEESSMTDIGRLVKDAIRHVILAGKDNKDLLTVSNAPRVAAVRAAFEALCGEQGVKTDVKITTELVGKYFVDVQEEDQLARGAAKPPQSQERYPDAVPMGDLEGEEVGGDLDALLESVDHNDIEE